MMNLLSYLKRLIRSEPEYKGVQIWVPPTPYESGIIGIAKSIMKRHTPSFLADDECGIVTMDEETCEYWQKRAERILNNRVRTVTVRVK